MAKMAEAGGQIVLGIVRTPSSGLRYSVLRNVKLVAARKRNRPLFLDPEQVRIQMLR